MRVIPDTATVWIKVSLLTYVVALLMTNYLMLAVRWRPWNRITVKHLYSFLESSNMLNTAYTYPNRTMFLKCSTSKNESKR